MLREKNQYSIVLFLCPSQTERSHLFIVIHLSFLVGINARLRENAGISCQRKLFTMVPPFFL